MNKIALIVGARPNFVKVAALIRELKRRDNLSFEWNLVHTGQHYDYEMDKVLFEDLELPMPDFFMYCGGGSVGYHIGQVIERTEYALKSLNCDAVMVFGDVNTALGAAITAKKLKKTLIHYEAGLRCGDMNMSEEQNRVIIDLLSDICLVTEQAGIDNLEYNYKKTYLVGDLMIDNLKHYKDSFILPKPVQNDKYGILTIHRAENVDDHNQYLNIINNISNLNIRIIYPVHPRNTICANVIINNIDFIHPLSYKEFIRLCWHSSIIITDSGGLQSEALYMGVPCLTLREVTEKPETVESGCNILVGTDWDRLKEGFDKVMDKNNVSIYQLPPLYDGKAAERIVDILEKL